MIYIRTERGIEKLSDWSEIESLAGFQKNISIENHKLVEIISVYEFPETTPCGLNHCHTQHNKGYVVQTNKNVVTNIGHKCGQTHFGVVFDEFVKTFNAAVSEKINREQVQEFLDKLPELEQKIESLKTKGLGAKKYYKILLQFKTNNDCVPDVIRRKLLNMLKSNNSELVVEQEATEDEIAIEEASTGKKVQKPFIVERPLGRISGLQALADSNRPKKVFITDIETPLERIKSIDIESTSIDSLIKATKVIENIEKAVMTAKNAVKLYSRFCTRDNLRILIEILEDDRQVTQFKRFISGLPSMRPK